MFFVPTLIFFFNTISEGNQELENFQFLVTPTSPNVLFICEGRTVQKTNRYFEEIYKKHSVMVRKLSCKQKLSVYLTISLTLTCICLLQVMSKRMRLLTLAWEKGFLWKKAGLTCKTVLLLILLLLLLLLVTYFHGHLAKLYSRPCKLFLYSPSSTFQFNITLGLQI